MSSKVLVKPVKLISFLEGVNGGRKISFGVLREGEDYGWSHDVFEREVYLGDGSIGVLRHFLDAMRIQYVGVLPGTQTPFPRAGRDPSRENITIGYDFKLMKRTDGWEKKRGFPFP
tara:strand:+ start:269 stop:616 length:348 start_codon:yes stop_codon:yes gene_type:complete